MLHNILSQQRNRLEQQCLRRWQYLLPTPELGGNPSGKSSDAKSQQRRNWDSVTVYLKQK